ncbi:pilus assembly protein PilP [Salinicola acroporae]|uniref:pilus assembly protein PilP n=1 Tax=Salinicola acroporae TaxID=1541440 RepID=UPI000DA1DE0E|nr:pilus assembly protein PilP [Salinicola acroporae]
MSVNRLLLAGMLIASGLLTGCQDADLGALEAQLDALRHKPEGQIAALPQMPQYATADYDQSQRRSPFVAEHDEQVEPVDRAPLPDADRPRQPLEAFELDSLTLVGTLMVGNTPSGLVAAPDGRVHRLFEGDYLGRDYGRVVDVESRALALVETVRDPQGDWTECRQRLAMAQPESDGASRRQP